MKVDISLVLSCLVFFVTSWCLIRQILRKIFRGYSAFYSWSFLVGAFGFAALELFMRLEADVPYGEKIRTGLLGLYSFSFIAIYFYTLMEEPQKNRLRPLTRLPLIGFLLGFYLAPFNAGLMLLLTEVLLTAYAWKTRAKIRYTARAQIKSSLLAPLILVAPAWGVGLWFLWSFSFKNAAVNAAIVKGKMLDYDKSSNEN